MTVDVDRALPPRWEHWPRAAQLEALRNMNREKLMSLIMEESGGPSAEGDRYFDKEQLVFILAALLGSENLGVTDS